eukprot:UN15382
MRTQSWVSRECAQITTTMTMTWDNYEMLREVQSVGHRSQLRQNVYMYHNHREVSNASRANHD